MTKLNQIENLHLFSDLPDGPSIASYMIRINFVSDGHKYVHLMLVSSGYPTSSPN